jgi:hypothetical protein
MKIHKKTLLVILTAIIISTLMSLVVHVPVRVFAVETKVPPLVPATITVLGNLTLKVENFTFTLQQDNETYTFYVESADVRILTIGNYNRTILVDVIATNCKITGSLQLSFNYLELHLTIIQRDQDDKAYAEAIVYKSLAEVLWNVICGRGEW